jgi:hypothetical protein
MPPKFKIFAIAAALAAGTSSAPMASIGYRLPDTREVAGLSAERASGSAIGRPLVLVQDGNHGPWSNTLSICTTGYIWYHGYCRRVAPPPPGCGNPGTGTGTANTLTGGSTPPAACPCAAGYVYSLGYCYPRPFKF